jgi:hypothetical protein
VYICHTDDVVALELLACSLLDAWWSSVYLPTYYTHTAVVVAAAQVCNTGDLYIYSHRPKI